MKALSVRSLLLKAPHQLEWVNEIQRELKPYEVRIKTIASSISIGSELPQYEGDARLGYPPSYPTMTGYENVGIVMDTGSAVNTVQVRQRVIGFYGYRTEAIVQSNSIVPVDNDISDKQALLAILSCDVAKGIRKLKPYPEETTLVTGCGAIGLLTIFVLSAYGVQNITAVDPIDSRQQLALEMGATSAVTPEEIAQDNNYFDIGLECSSAQDAFALLQAKMTASAKICILSDGNREPLILTPDFHRKELTLYASSDGWNYSKHAPWFFDLIRSSLTPIEKLFNVTIRPDQIPETFELLARQQLSVVKVFITGFE